jgi:hypothetical protein
MRQPTFFSQEKKLEAERLLKCKGTACVKLEHLNFEENDLRELDQKNVQRLKAIFQTSDIRRLEPSNHIPALVTQSDLENAIQASETSAERLMVTSGGTFPMLTFPSSFRLTCLHGRHRVQAAHEALCTTDKWWTVDLYLEGK